eukprot:6893170-Pyramimonas_sp.AAC.1
MVTKLMKSIGSWVDANSPLLLPTSASISLGGGLGGPSSVLWFFRARAHRPESKSTRPHELRRALGTHCRKLCVAGPL